MELEIHLKVENFFLFKLITLKSFYLNYLFVKIKYLFNQIFHYIFEIE